MSAPSLLALPGTSVPACCEDETWKPLPGWPHEVSTCGQVRSIDRLEGDGIWRLGAMLPQDPDKRRGKGYLYVHLRDGKRRRKAPVSVVVLEAHDKPKPGPEYEACHGNDIRTDNHLANLCWDTKTANLAKMWEQRRQRDRIAASVAGGAFPQEGVHPVPAIRRYGGSAAPGTGSLPSIPVSPSHSPSLKPSFRTLRTPFRALRALGRAS